MSPAKRKGARRTAVQRTVKTLPQERALLRAGLIDKKKGLTEKQRTNLAKLSMPEVQALLRAKRKLEYPGTMEIRGFFF
jgi:hypothetical protein